MFDSFQPPVGQLEEEEELSQHGEGPQCLGAEAEEDCCRFTLTVWGCSTTGVRLTSGICCDGAAAGSLCRTSTEGAAAAESSCVSSAASLSDISRWLCTGSRDGLGVLEAEGGPVAVGGAPNT